MTINTTTLRQALQETEQALNVLDASMAIFEARVNANRLPVRWAEQSVKLLTGGRAATWALDFDGWKANPAAAIAVIVLCNGVHVWTTDPANGQLADYLGAITPP